MRAISAMALLTLAACTPAPVIAPLPATPPVDIRAECAEPELVETDAFQVAVTLAVAFHRCKSAALFLDYAWRETARSQ